MSRLIVFVSNYPFGQGEPFFNDELKYLSNKFDSILIVRKSSDVTKELYNIEGINNIELLSIPKVKKLKYKCYFTLFKYVIKTFRTEKSKLKSFKKIKLYLGFLCKSIDYEDAIKKNLKIEKHDILYTYWLDDLTLGMCFLIQEMKLSNKIVSRCHGWDVYEYRHELKYLPLRSYLYNNLDLVATISDDAYLYIKNTYYKEYLNNITCFRLGVEDLNNELLKNKIDAHKQITLLSFSTFSRVKNLELLIETLESINDFNIEWYHIGDGLFNNNYESYLYETIEKKIQSKNNIQVRLLGFLNQDQIAFFLNNTYIDLMINTSHFEGIPVTIMQAKSFGIPVVAPNVGGINEIVNNKNGFLLSSKPSVREIYDTFLKISELSEFEVQKKRLESRATYQSKFNSTINYNIFSDKLVSMLVNEIRQCSKCLFTSDVYPSIKLDVNGICDICHNYDQLSKRKVLEESEGKEILNSIINRVKKEGASKKYDCLLGVSGGVDSSFLMIKMKEWGLRPLIIHVDNGWNSELAVANIEKLVNILGFDLYTHVLDWNEMRDLQLAFFKSSVIDIDIPFDNACWKKMFELVVDHKIKYIFSGHNTVTEGWMPDSFVHYKLDKINIKDIHKKFGTLKLKKIKFLGPIDLFYYQKIRKIKFITPLDYIKYDKKEVLELLESKYQWRPYGNKHYENIFTRFYQGYILPTKFKVDKRISHLSTLICSGQLTKEAAQLELTKEIYDPIILEDDKTFFIKKMNLTLVEFNQIMNSPIKKHTDFRSYLNLYKKLGRMKKLIKMIVKKNEL